METVHHIEPRFAVYFWRVARVVLSGLFVIVTLTKGLLSPGVLRSYAFDVVVPAFLYVEFRGLHAPKRSIRGACWIGRSPERAALALFSATAAAEFGQYFKAWTHLPGVFDIYEIVAYAAGIGACYAVDTLLRPDGRRGPTFSSTGQPHEGDSA